MSMVVLNFSFDDTSSSNLLLKNIFIVLAVVFLDYSAYHCVIEKHPVGDPRRWRAGCLIVCFCSNFFC
jgi:hypothetical protein